MSRLRGRTRFLFLIPFIIERVCFFKSTGFELRSAMATQYLSMILGRKLKLKNPNFLVEVMAITSADLAAGPSEWDACVRKCSLNGNVLTFVTLSAIIRSHSAICLWNKNYFQRALVCGRCAICSEGQHLLILVHN